MLRVGAAVDNVGRAPFAELTLYGRTNGVVRSERVHGWERVVAMKNSLAVVELVLVPATEKYEPHDERWRSQVAALCSELRQNVGDVRLETTPSAGEKGLTSEIILALGSSGAISAAVDVFRLWLERDKSRSLEIAWTEGNLRRTVAIKGTDIDKDTFTEFAKAAVRSREA